MKNILKTFVDNVCSFSGFLFIAGVIIMLLIVSIYKQQNVAQELAIATTKACYDNGLIKVDTDAGFYCVAPANLVKVK
jgi:ABC-type tungstate transport system permease subunit